MEFDELSLIKEIADGRKLDSFKKEDYNLPEGTVFPTQLMILAALSWHGKEGYLEVPDDSFSERAAFLAVQKNFRALNRIPDERKAKLTPALLEAAGKIHRNELGEFLSVLEAQSPDVLKRMTRRSADILRFLPPEKRKEIERQKEMQKKGQLKAENMPKQEENSFAYGFEYEEEFSNPDETTSQMFLLLPVKEQTKDRLDALTDKEEDLPWDFIKRISIPNRNAAFYIKEGNQNLAEFWKARIIPYLNLEVCREIAAKHPESSIATPAYLDKKAVKAFWERKKDMVTKAEMTRYFLKFPEEMLDPSMSEDLVLSEKVLSHAPKLLKDTDYCRKFLSRNPAAVLRIPELQTPPRILAFGVPLNSRTIQSVKDIAFREKLAMALRIPNAKKISSE